MKVDLNTISALSPLAKNQNSNFKRIYTIISNDSVSFSGNIIRKQVNVDDETAEFVANSLSTSTSGHRAPYGSDKFTPEIVKLLTLGVAKYAKDEAQKQEHTPMVIIGGDTRDASRESLPLILNTLLTQGVDVFYIEDPVPTPLLAYMTEKLGADISVLLTASHNPWNDGGYNLVTKEGAIAPPSVTKEVAKNVVDIAKTGTYYVNKKNTGNFTEIYPYNMYKELLDGYNIIDWDNIRNSGIAIYYDALQGTGQYVLPEILRDNVIPYTQIYSGEHEGPNPTEENLEELSEMVQSDKSKLKIGLANDGDADRFGIVDDKGNFITPNDVILLTAYHLVNNKGMEGYIIRSQGTTSKLDLFAKNHDEVKGVIQTPVGFKYIAEDILSLRDNDSDIIVAGEESGGLTIGKHIPEKDGIIALLMIIDLIAKEKKPLSEIMENVNSELGCCFSQDTFSNKYTFDKDKEIVMSRLKKVYDEAMEGKTQFGDFEIDVEKTKETAQTMESYKKGGDGVKLYFTDGSSVLVRKSGTEPKVKAYIEAYADSTGAANEKIAALKEELGQYFYDTTGV